MKVGGIEPEWEMFKTSIQAIYSKDGMLFTSTEEVIGQWKEHFEELLNPTDTPSMVEA